MLDSENPELHQFLVLLGDIARRGHRLRYPDQKTAPSGNLLAGNSDEAERRAEVVNDQSASQS